MEARLTKMTDMGANVLLLDGIPSDTLVRLADRHGILLIGMISEEEYGASGTDMPEKSLRNETNAPSMLAWAIIGDRQDAPVDETMRTTAESRSMMLVIRISRSDILGNEDATAYAKAIAAGNGNASNVFVDMDAMMEPGTYDLYRGIWKQGAALPSASSDDVKGTEGNSNSRNTDTDTNANANSTMTSSDSEHGTVPETETQAEVADAGTGKIATYELADGLLPDGDGTITMPSTVDVTMLDGTKSVGTVAWNADGEDDATVPFGIITGTLSIQDDTVPVSMRVPRGMMAASSESLADMSDVSVGSIPEQEWTGQPVTPQLTVSHDGTDLVEGTDYTVAYEDNVEPGEAKATITGIGNYVGHAVSKFDISKADLTGDTIEQHFVPTEMPSAATLDLFDYWLTKRDDHNGQHYTPEYWEMGISKGHEFKFASDTTLRNTVVNQWTGGATPRQNIIYPVLKDGYPMVASEEHGGVSGVTRDDSLDYVFDHEDVDTPGITGSRMYKKAYTNVQGLFTNEGNGMYSYDTNQNAAWYDEDANTMRVIDTSTQSNAVGTGGIYGQFYPFDSPSVSFKTNPDGSYVRGSDGKLVPLHTNTLDAGPYNHYFAMHLTVPFQQPKGGLVTNGSRMTYDFSGDDDVWIFIDGVLVGDLGGIHDKSTISIDFSTGIISGTAGIADTTIRKQFEHAGIGTDGFSGDTFSDYSTHTMQVFYIERGNNLSNLRMRFNLMAIARLATTKVASDTGNQLDGAEFSLYQDADTVVDASGNRVVRDGAAAYAKSEPSNGDGIGVTHLFAEDGTYWLKETKAPGGYQALPRLVKVVVKDGKATVADDSDISTDERSENITVMDHPLHGAMPASGGGGALALVLAATGVAGTVGWLWWQELRQARRHPIGSERTRANARAGGGRRGTTKRRKAIWQGRQRAMRKSRTSMPRR